MSTSARLISTPVVNRPHRQPKSAHRNLFRNIHRFEHRRNTHAVAVAGGAGRRCHVGEGIEDHVGLTAGETDRAGVGQALLGVTVDDCVGELALQAVLELVAEFAKVFGVTIRILSHKAAGLTEPDYLDHVFGSGRGG